MGKIKSIYVSALILVGFTLPAQAMESIAPYAFMVDYETGAVLLNKEGDTQMPPSSMSKLMTSYIISQELEEGKITLDTTFPVSEKAWKMGGSKMFVHVGDMVSVSDLLRGIIVQSGNDACIVAAEGIAGSEAAFAERMNAVATKLGLSKSHFVNATGWPDEGHVMSPRDLAALASHIIKDFPQEYALYAEKEFTYGGITQPNRNRLLNSSLGVDGLKTGHTEAGGYGITLSAKDAESGRRVILVLNGLTSDDERVQEGSRLLSIGLKAYINKQLVKAGQHIANAKVWFGEKDEIALSADQSIVTTLPKDTDTGVTYTLSYLSPLPAPIAQGEHVADLLVQVKGQETLRVPLVAAEAVGEATGITWFESLIESW